MASSGVASTYFPGLSPEEVNELREAFDLFDGDGSGELDFLEMQEALKMTADLSTLNRKHVFTMITEVDEFKTRKMDFTQFVELMRDNVISWRMRIEDESFDELERVFKIFDFDAKGSITEDKLRLMA